MTDFKKTRCGTLDPPNEIEKIRDLGDFLLLWRQLKPGVNQLVEQSGKLDQSHREIIRWLIALADRVEGDDVCEPD